MQRIRPPEGGKGGQAMKMRYYAAIVTGCLAEVMTMAAMWVWTDVELLEVAVWAVLIYLVAMCTVLWVTEPKREQARKHTKPQIYDLKESK